MTFGLFLNETWLVWSVCLLLIDAMWGHRKENEEVLCGGHGGKMSHACRSRLSSGGNRSVYCAVCKHSTGDNLIFCDETCSNDRTTMMMMTCRPHQLSGKMNQVFVAEWFILRVTITWNSSRRPQITFSNCSVWLQLRIPFWWWSQVFDIVGNFECSLSGKYLWGKRLKYFSHFIFIKIKMYIKQLFISVLHCIVV